MDGTSLGAAAGIAVVLMPIVSLVKKPSWPHEVSYLVGMVAAVIAAAAGALIDGSVHNVQDFIPYFGTAFATAQTLYHLYFSKSSLNDKLTNTGA